MKKLFFMSCFFGSLLGLLSTVSAYATSDEAKAAKWLEETSIDYKSILNRETVNSKKLNSIIEEIHSKGGDLTHVSYVLNNKTEEAKAAWLKKNYIDYENLLNSWTVDLNDVKSLVEEIHSKGGDSAHVSYVLNRKTGLEQETLLHTVVRFHKIFKTSKGTSLPEIVKYLLEQGADPKVLDKRGYTALHSLARGSDPFKLETAKILYDAYPESIHMLSEHSDSILQEFFWITPLDVYAKNKRSQQAAVDFVEFLIDKRLI